MSVKRALIGSPLMPEFDKESGSRRIFDLIMLMREAGWAVSFVAENARGGERYADLLQQHGVAVYRGFGEKIECLLTRGRLDLAIFAFWHIAEALLPMVRRLSPSTRVVVDSIDLHFVRNARRLFQAARSGPSNSAATLGNGLDANFGSQLIRELNTYAAADGVLAVSQKEADLINDLSDDPALAYVMPDCEDLPLSTLSMEERRGITFIGNFRHPPNVGAAEFLCRQIVPRIAPEVLARHPIYIVGNALNEQICSLAGDHPNVRMVGWVPSVLPYLERARVSVVPLLYGAGTKRKLLQALLLGTPTISTTVGIEGLGLQPDEHVLVADAPDDFAASVERLLGSAPVWERLSRQGREHVVARHGREVVRQRLMTVLSSILAKPVKGASPSPPALPVVVGRQEYQEMVERVRQVIAETVPEDEIVAVVSRGDDELLKLPQRRGWHFPQQDGGVFAGHYPRNGAAAVDHLEVIRKKGAGFLVFPDTALWWLDHYRELKEHLLQYCPQIAERDGTCVIYDIRDLGHNRHRHDPRASLSAARTADVH